MINFVKINLFLYVSLIFLLNSCANLPGGDARKNPPQPDLRVKKNLEEGKGFRLDSALGGNKSTNFEFASSNELWRASLDIIDFMPLLSANYSGGIIITDWYSEKNSNDSVKITIRFLSNEIRSDAVNIKVFYKKCDLNMKCIVSENNGNIRNELKREILKKAAIYKKQTQDKNFKPYDITNLKD
tara:strand:- start:55 stop:609 length:555 start_codon:yes stop_codon:yes gene_type:complete